MLYHETSCLRSCQAPIPRLFLKPYKTVAHDNSNQSNHRITELLSHERYAIEFRLSLLKQIRYFSGLAHDASLPFAFYSSGLAGSRAK